MRPPVHARPFMIAVATVCALSPLSAQTLQTVPMKSVVHSVPVSLEAFLPAAAEGWTRSAVDAARATVSPTCSYTFAYATYTNGTLRVRMTIADTAFDEGALATLANLVKIFPADYVGLVPPATSVRRLMFGDSPAAELWDATKGDGEFTVVIDGRFVVKAEGLRLTDVATARRFVEMVDVEKLRRVK
jgi:hypothetical protein